jgi:serine/threonine-protein kinase RIO1
VADLRKDDRSDGKEANIWQAEPSNGVHTVVRIC